MASSLPPIFVEIQADVAQLKKGLADATNAIKGMDDNVKKADTGMTNFMNKLKSVGATLGATFAASQLVGFAKDTVMAASNMAESVSKVAVVFGQGASEVYKFGEAAAENMGISNQAALEAAGTYGNLFQAFGMGQGEAQKMSMNLVQLASDMASFNNTSIDDAILALRSGLSGETEPLKRFGVALNDVRLKAEAAALGLGEYKGTLPPLIKSQAAYSLIMKDTILSQGDYARTAEGTANTMKTLQAKFMDAKVALGDALMPAFRALLKILEMLIPILKAIGKFFQENGEAIKIYVTIVLSAVAAFKAYRGILLLTKTAQQAYVVTMTLLRGGQLASIASTNGLAAAMLKLNAAMRANPIGIIITVLALLGAGFVAAWKKSETFRGIVIKAMQGVLNIVAKVAEGFGKFFSLLGKIPGMGWAKSIGKGLDDISAKIETTSKNLSDLKSGFKGMGNISMTADSAGAKSGTTKSGTTGTAGALTEEEKKRKEKLDKLKKDVKDVYKDMNEVIADANEKAQDALETRNERIAEAHERYNERVADLTEQYNERIAEATERHKEQEANIKERYNEQMAEAQKRYQEADKAARKRNTEELIKIAKDYAEKTKDLEVKLQEKLADLQAKAIEKKTDLTVKAAEKQAGIVQQSIARLTSAFASGTAFSLTDMFKKGKEGGGLLGVMKKQLDDAKKLQEGAGYLAGQGYSQTFIEQVVKAGPEAGLALIEEIKGGSPEQQAEIKATFNALETISDTGMDALAKSMNNGANLATSELRKAYDQVAVDLKASLNEVDRELTENMVSQQAAFNLAMAEAAKVRDERIAESHKVLEEALAEATKNLLEAQAEAKAEQDKALAEAYAALTKAREEAQKELNKGLAKAQEELQKALIEAQKAYEKAIDKINEETQKKLDKLKAKIAEIAAAMAQLAAMSASMAAMANAPVYTPIVASGGGGGGSKTSITGPTTNVSITGVNLTSPHDTATAVVNSIKFGNVVVPTAPTKLASGESGAIGAANISSRITTPKIDMHTAAMRAR